MAPDRPQIKSFIDYYRAMHYSPFLHLWHWSVTVMLSKKIDALDNWCLWRILNVHWSEFVTNDEICRAATSVRHCSQSSSVLQPSAPHRSLTRPLPCSTGLHFGSSWLQTEDWSSQTILAENGGGWPATNEPRTGNVEAACSGQIGMAETRDNGYVNDKLLKRRERHWWIRIT